jgi:hypothetical protein
LERWILQAKWGTDRIARFRIYMIRIYMIRIYMIRIYMKRFVSVPSSRRPDRKCRTRPRQAN